MCSNINGSLHGVTVVTVYIVREMMMMIRGVSRVFLLCLSLLSKRRDNRDTVTDCASIAGNVVPKTGDLPTCFRSTAHRLAYETPTISVLSH